MIKTITLGGLTFGPWDSKIVYENSSGFDFPQVRVDIKEFGNADGANLGQYLYGSRKMSIEGTIFGDDEADFENNRRLLQAAVSLKRGLQRMVIETNGGLIVRADVIVTNRLGMNYTKGERIRCPFRLELEAPFPFLLSDTVITKRIVPAAGGGGPVPAPIPFPITGADESSNIIVLGGNVEAFFNARIYGPITNPVLRNASTDLQLSITYDLPTADDYIDLDFRLHTARLNDNLNVYQYVSADPEDWWKLQVGSNQIRLLSSAVNGGFADLTYQDHYLGV